jgi:hypothetical protein
MINDIDLKGKFVEMCKQIVDHKGQLVCLYSNIEYNEDFSYIYNSENYDILKEKMENLLKIVNKDKSLLHKDVEDELWNLI